MNLPSLKIRAEHIREVIDALAGPELRKASKVLIVVGFSALAAGGKLQKWLEGK